MPTLQIVPQGPPTSRKPSKIPAFFATAYTLKISVSFLARNLLGTVSMERGEGMLRWWGRKIFEASNAGLAVEGRESFEAGRPYVVMSNHRSIIDIPALFLAVPSFLRMVLKSELTRVPIWGRALVASGFVPVDRGNSSRAIAQLDVAKEQLAKGVSIWIAPEGTRSRNGELGSFKKGGFHLAMQFGTPIIPTWIEGTEAIIPPGDYVVHYDRHATIRFGRPIPVAGRTDVDELLAEVREAMVALRV